MAQASTETNTFRDRVTRLLDTMEPQLASTIAIVEGAGEDDSERAEFFREHLGTDADPATDVTFSELAEAAVALRDLKAWLDNNRTTLAKLRR